MGLGRGPDRAPAVGHLVFLTERPYLPPGTLRQVLVGEFADDQRSDDEIMRVVGMVHAEPIVARLGGLDTQDEWSDILSMREQETLAIARVILTQPTFVILHNPARTLDTEQITLTLQALCACSVTCINFTGTDEPNDHLAEYDAVLDIAADGSWTWEPIRDGVVVDVEARSVSAP